MLPAGLALWGAVSRALERHQRWAWWMLLHPDSREWVAPEPAEPSVTRAPSRRSAAPSAD
ncbi:hypothetical protein ACI8AJ_05960 [Modestobacter sp. SYSU DS0985]